MALAVDLTARRGGSVDAVGLEDLLAALDRGSPDGSRLVHLERLPARPARTADLTEPLPAAVREALGVDEFWSHQAEAIDLARTGRSVAVATGTASGKSLCYQAPIAEAVCQPVRAGTSLLVFPTKALAQDQLRALAALGLDRLVPTTYDGDSSPEERTWARSHANVLLTNPEMLHSGILPHHGKWATFLHRLEYVVVDELHVLRGIFGTHVAHLLRRLRRVCAHYGSDPTFVFSSATIGDPGRLASNLCGLDVAEVTDDGSPRGERLFALWNPPPIDDEAEDGPRVSANRETATLMAELVEHGRRTITFCRSRKGTEIVAADVDRRLPEHLSGSVRPYRGGYLAAERREIEAELFTGALQGVVATTALELGVDIGGLDACVLDGFPGTIASMWQQAGRAGREGQQSIAVLVAGEDQLDQWLITHPRDVFTRPPEPAVINPTNPFVLEPHLACAAFELPLTHADATYWPREVLDEGVRSLVVGDHLKIRRKRSSFGWEPRAVWARRGWPTHGVGLRGGSAHEYRIATEAGDLVGTVDEGRAFRSVHPGAVYLHQGRPYRVDRLDLDDRVAFVSPCDGGTTTQARTDTDFRILEEEERRMVGRTRLRLGSIEVRSQVTGYQERDVFSGEVVAREELDLPASYLVTRGFWYTVAPDVLHRAGVDPGAAPGTLHAVEHAAIGMLPLFTICDRWDVGGVSTLLQADTGLPTIVIYDGYAGGAGIAELGYAVADRHLRATLEAIEVCPCEAGCPSCVQSPKCGNFNEPLDKGGALRLLRTVL